MATYTSLVKGASRVNNDIKELLFAWGEWSRHDVERLGFKNSWQMIFDMAPENDNKVTTAKKKDNTIFICDDTACRIDHIVSEMKRSMLPCAIVIRARYVNLVSIEAIGRGPLAACIYGRSSKKSVGKHKVRELLAKGEGFIEGRLLL